MSVRERLENAVAFQVETNPFVVAVSNGTLQREAIRDYACVLTNLSAALPRSLAIIMSLCPDRNVRQFLLNNLLEEDGAIEFSTGNGLAMDHSRAHPVLGEKFALAAGATPEQIRTTQATSPWFDEQLSMGNWIAALAYMSVGVEAGTPRMFELIIPPLRKHYGFSEDALEFLIIHVEADKRHGDEARDLVERAAQEAGQVEEAVNAARRGALAWWQLHRRLARSQAQLARA